MNDHFHVLDTLKKSYMSFSIILIQPYTRGLKIQPKFQTSDYQILLQRTDNDTVHKCLKV